VSENISTEIQRTFDFFRATSQEDRVDQIYLSGGAANVHGLRDLLSDRLDAPVELLNPFLNVRYSEKDFDPEFLDEIGPSAAIAVGLAVRRVGDR
jgi:type IV pilus assembly protein PilM